MNQLIFLIVSVLIFTTGNILGVIILGKQKSISQFYYALKAKYGDNTGHVIFTLFMWSFAITAFLSGVNIHSSGTMEDLQNAFLLLAVGSICFVGAAPDYKQTLENGVHYTGAVAGIIFGNVYLALGDFWYFAIASGVILLVMELTLNDDDLDCKTRWQEIAAMMIICIGIFANLV